MRASDSNFKFFSSFLKDFWRIFDFPHLSGMNTFTFITSSFCALSASNFCHWHLIICFERFFSQISWIFIFMLFTGVLRVFTKLALECTPHLRSLWNSGLWISIYKRTFWPIFRTQLGVEAKKMKKTCWKEH